LIRNLIDCSSKGGNFVLNVGPMASGEFPAQHKAILAVMGKWLATNGEAIYSSEPAPEAEIDTTGGTEGYTTKVKNNLYIEILHWPAGDKPVQLTIHRKGFDQATWLDASLPGTQILGETADGVTKLSIPKPATVDPYATVIKVSFKDE
jgi:alpha-L-fucosidase